MRRKTWKQKEKSERKKEHHVNETKMDDGHVSAKKEKKERGIDGKWRKRGEEKRGSRGGRKKNKRKKQYKIESHQNRKLKTTWK